MGNVYMEADQIRYKGQYRTVQEALDNAGSGPELPTAYSVEGLVCEGVEIEAGGYYKIGSTVFVNMHIKALASGNASITGFPAYDKVSEQDIALCNMYDQTWGDPYKNAKISKLGALNLTVSGDWLYTLTTVYLCNS